MLLSTPNTPKSPRRAKRAGLLHLPVVLLISDPKYPRNRRASTPVCFVCYSFVALDPNVGRSLLKLLELKGGGGPKGAQSPRTTTPPSKYFVFFNEGGRTGDGGTT